jgi:membrane-associated phospholipid phosphatase
VLVATTIGRASAADPAEPPGPPSATAPSATPPPATPPAVPPELPRAESPRVEPPPVDFHVSVPVSLSITLAGGALWGTWEILASKLAPSPCNWCDRAPDGTDTLNGFDASVRKALVWHDTKTADTLSSVFSFGLAPLTGTGIAALIAWHDDRLNELPEDILVVTEATVITGNVTDITKYSVGRERPYVHFRTPEERARLKSTNDNLSFFSGHAAIAFTLATSAGTIGSVRKYRLAPLMWIAGLTFATAGAYLRIAADRHYATDVLVGGAVGSGIGFAVPYFAHGPHRLRIGALTDERARGLVVGGVW